MPRRRFLGMPIFEVFYAVLILGGLVVALIIGCLRYFR
jgi:hypothetical protein